MDKILLVARWEFMRNFKWKQDIISYLVMLTIYGAIFAVQVWDKNSTQKVVNLAVIGEINTELDNKFSLSTLTSALTTEQLLDEIEHTHLDGVLKVEKSGVYTLYVSQQSSWQAELKKNLIDAQKSILLQEMGVSNEQLKKLENPITLNLINQAEKIVGGNVKTLAILASVLSAMAVFSSFGLCFTSVTQEKQHRITEQLLTCINHQQWVDGKALGLCLSSFKSLITTSLMMLIVFSGISVFSDGGQNLNVSAAVISQLILFCVLGVLFWNYVFVGFAATIDDPNHSGKTGLMMLPMVPVMLVFIIMGEPNGQVAKVLSLLPLTSISFMPMRIASMSVPLWHIALSLLFLVVGIYYVRLFATRVFRANITLFGKEPGWADIWRSMLKNHNI
ncbi:ABC transporter permease [uncultured Paraglaciecola sp.]|uniref:ABC transporter permease n=1 Tax=uncultured Paraglaciecola sp. TaxID=1765024 RepID=UPI002597E739|nr:ABC transporter permease [uncultured Paraglaciecola sp.]